MATDTPTEPQKAQRPNRLGIAAATILAVITASTLAQALTFAAHGIAAEYSEQWSPGLLTIVAAFWMAAVVKSWASWRRWIWLPVALAVALSVAIVIFTVSIEQAAAEQAAIEEHERMCSDARAELDELVATHESLVIQSNALAGPSPFGDGDTRPPTPLSPGMTDWAEVAGTGSYTDAWNHYLAYGGPDMETKITELDAAIAADCG